MVNTIMRPNLIRFCLAVCLLLSCVFSRGAFANNWNKSFSTQTLSSNYKDGIGAIMVISAGEEKEISQSAARALKLKLKEIGAITLLSGESLGDVSSESDAQIIEKCQQFPVKQIAIVRGFRGNDASPDTAIIIFYTKKNDVDFVLNITSSMENAPLVSIESPIENASADSKTIAQESAPELSKEKEFALKEYADKYIWTEKGTGIVAYGKSNTLQVSAHDELFFVQGENHTSLVDDVEFLKAVGEAEKAKSYKRRKKMFAASLLIVGLSAIGGAVLIGLGKSKKNDYESEKTSAQWKIDNCNEEFDPFDRCLTQLPNEPVLIGYFLGGGTLIAVGMIAAIVGIVRRPQNIGYNEKLEIAKRYNLELRRQLNLSQEDVSHLPTETKRISLKVSPSIFQNGMGIGLAGTF